MASIPNPLPTSSAQQDGQAISGGALNITKGSFLAVVLTEFLLAFDGIFDRLFGESPPTWVKPAVMITLIAVWGLIAVADVLARGYAHGHAQSGLVPVSPGLIGDARVRVEKDGSDVIGRLTAVRAIGSTEVASVEWLVTSDDGRLEWAPQSRITRLSA